MAQEVRCMQSLRKDKSVDTVCAEQPRGLEGEASRRTNVIAEEPINDADGDGGADDDGDGAPNKMHGDIAARWLDNDCEHCRPVYRKLRGSGPWAITNNL